MRPFNIKPSISVLSYMLSLFAFSICAFAAQPEQQGQVQQFILETHKTLLEKNHDLFCFKMQKASKSEFNFFRAFPKLFYSNLRSHAAAPLLAQTPVIFLVGDVHQKNIELIEKEKLLIPQFDDFDESENGPAGLDVVRMLTSACIQYDRAKRACLDLADEARRTYVTSLGSDFDGWLATIQEEDAVASAIIEKVDWLARAEKPINDTNLHRATGLTRFAWQPFLDFHSGLSSLGLPRILFISPIEDRFIFENKLWSPSSVRYFTARKSELTYKERLQKVSQLLRQFPLEAQLIDYSGAYWLLKQRQSKRMNLNTNYVASSIRIMAGLLGQAHRGQKINPAVLTGITAPLIKEIGFLNHQQHSELVSLMERDVWKCNQIEERIPPQHLTGDE